MPANSSILEFDFKSLITLLGSLYVRPIHSFAILYNCSADFPSKVSTDVIEYKPFSLVREQLVNTESGEGS